MSIMRLNRNRFYGKLAAILAAAALTAAGITGCASVPAAGPVPAQTAQESAAEEEEETAEEPVEEPAERAAVRIGSLKGPTTMGLVNLMKAAEDGSAEGDYAFTMAVQADEIAAGIVGGSLDAAFIPANLASVLYNKTDGGVCAAAINTLGVLYCVTGDENIASVKDLEGKTIVTTGQGTTPEYSIRYLLDANGIGAELEFKSEAAEVAALLKEDSRTIAVLPQPFATVAQAQNEELSAAFSLADEWDAVSEGASMLVTGVTVIRKDFLEEHPAEAALFLEEAGRSAAMAAEDPDATAELIASYGIIEKAPIARKALPFCNIVCITGEEMKKALSGYLDVLAGFDPKSVGGSVPADDFYYTGF